jgi:transposase InsO family protein
VQRITPRIEPPNELVLNSERELSFRRFKSRWDSYYILSRLSEETVDYQRALLLYTLGDSAACVVENSDKYATDKSLKTILTVLEQYCVGERNVVHERFKFNIRSQLADETFDAFYADLRSLADKCSFNYRPAADSEVPPVDEMLRDRIVLGVKEDAVRKKLISQGNNLTLEQAVRVCRSNEVTSTVMQSVAKGAACSEGGAIDAVRGKPDQYKHSKQKPSNQSQTSSQGGRSHATSRAQQFNKSSYNNTNKCMRCGREPSHPKEDCPAKDAECRKCRKIGHYQAQCRSKTIGEVNEYGFLFTGEFRIGQLTTWDAWRADVDVNGHMTDFKLDTGADGTVISDSIPWLNKVQLQETGVKLYGPGGKELQVLGTFEAKLKHRSEIHKETVYVITNQTTSLLSRMACEKLKLVTCQAKEQGEVTKDVRVGFPKLFSGLGMLKDYSYQISLRPECRPVCIFTPRKVPLPLREKTKLKLEEMVRQGVISQVAEATDWCSGMVTVVKPSGDIRICVDLTGLNKAVRREVYPMPAVDDSIALLSGSKIFSKLDANSGFWQIDLCEDSRKLTTFLTPFGRFCFNRLPFGISSAPEIFSRAMSRLLCNIENVICHMDDILIHGKDRESHDKTLNLVLKRLTEAGLTLNDQKCEIGRTTVKFLGHIIDSQGISPDPSKISAISNFPPPTNKTELRRINGMLNQLAKFIPHLATLNAPMRELLKESRHWIWGPAQDQAFRRIKGTLTSTKVMAHYDSRLKTIVTTDASQNGLGATMFQIQHDGTRRPVYYASRSMTETEQNYAVIEKEALAMAWACDKLDQFLRGLPFVIETDHKPLVRLMNVKDLDQVPARVLRLRLRLMRYAPTLEYIKGKDNHLADALSRAPTDRPSSVETLFVQEVEEGASVLFTGDPAILEYKEAQQLDPICQEVLQSVRKGWTAYKTDANTAIHSYWDEKGHFTEVDGLLAYNQRVVVPGNLRLKTLEQIHQAHQGIVKCQARARRAVWWPGMSSQIKEMVQHCRTCRINSPTPVEPLNSSTLPQKAWSRLGADLFEFRKKNYLLVVDYYSRFIEVRPLDSLESLVTIDKFKSIFSIHGVPDMIISDNGKQFDSRYFREFARSYGFQHVTSSPRYPKANGEAERAVGTVKRLWNKSDDPYLSLMIYRATPLENGFTPSELLMNRLLRTTLPTLPSQRSLQTPVESIREKEMDIRERTMTNYNKRHQAHQLPALRPGTNVFIKDMKKEGKVIRNTAPRSYEVQTNTGTIRRNRSALVDVREEGPVVPVTPNAP